MKFKVEGIPELKRALNQVAAELGHRFADALEDIADTLVNDCYFNVPVDTGALRASGDYFLQGTGWETVAIVGWGFPTFGFFKDGKEKNPTEYAVAQYFGSPYAANWIGVTLAENEPKYQQILIHHMT